MDRCPVEPRQDDQRDLLLADLHTTQETSVAFSPPSPVSDHAQAWFRAPTLKPPDLKKSKKLLRDGQRLKN